MTRGRNRSIRRAVNALLTRSWSAGVGAEHVGVQRRGPIVRAGVRRRNRPVPRLAAWSLGAGIVATVGANLAHGVGHGPVGALVSAWPALALVGTFELLMMLIRTRRGTQPDLAEDAPQYPAAPPVVQEAPPELTFTSTLEQIVRARHEAGQSQRAIARELNIDRRKVKRIIDQAA